MIGAGGAGLRAAIEAKAAGADVGLVCKSLLGKAHTVMAEGGVAAALGHVAPSDSWQVHFRDTMVGGKLLNNPRMAELHATEAPDARPRARAVGRRVRPDGRRPDPPAPVRRALASAPRARRRPDRPRDDPDAPGPCRRAGHRRSTWSARSRRLITGPGGVTGAFGYWRTTGQPVVFPAKAIVLATGGIGKAYEVTSNSWEYSGDGQALAYAAGAELIDMEFVQFHPTGMVWPPGVRGLLVTEAVRGEGGILRNKDGERFMWKYLPEDRRARVRGDRRGGRPLGHGAVRGPRDRRPPAARAVHPRQRLARDLHRGPRGPRLAPRRRLPRHQLPAAPSTVRRKLPSMYEQFKELADVDITTGPMEVGPTTHYVMGGIRVDAETGATTVAGLFAAGEVAGGMHGANRLGGNSLSDLLVFGATDRRRRGRACGGHAPTRRTSTRSRSRPRSRSSPRRSSGPRARTRTRSSATSRTTMQRLVGHLPGRGGPRRGARAAGRRCAGAGRRVAGDRRPRLQPGLEPRLRAAQPADRLRGDHPQRPPADREPRRAQPARLTRPPTTTTWGGRNSVVVARPGRHDDAWTRRHCPTMTDELRSLLGSGGH